MIGVAVILFCLGLCLGSFLNAMVYRMKKKMDWVRGRSQCDHCKHQLAAKDLVPLLSWLFMAGRCRYCRKAISWQHPAVELATGLTFALSYLWWPGGLDAAGNYVLFVTWLASSVGLIALLVYDFRWMLLPSKILYPTFAVAAAGRLVYLVGYAADKPHALMNWLLAIVVASGIFLVLFYVSSGRWIGYGDVRLGLVSGTLLATPAKGLLMIFIASLLGSFASLPQLVNGRKKMSSRIPFGPFLIMATATCVLFGDSIINWYTGHWL